MAWVVVDPFQFPDLMGKLGLETDVFPAAAVHRLSEERVYPYPQGQSFDHELVEQWVLDVQQDRIEPWTPPATGKSPGHDEL